VLLMAAAPGAFDMAHFQRFKSELDSYLHDKEAEVLKSRRGPKPASARGHAPGAPEDPNEDPFFLSC
jgi:hypothetical protein